jgi:hypothetical protein
MNGPFASLASLSCSLLYMVDEDASGWLIFAAVAFLVYAWRHRDD